MSELDDTLKETRERCERAQTVLAVCEIRENVDEEEQIEASLADIPALLRLVDVLREQRDVWYAEAYRLGSSKSHKTNVERQNAACLDAMKGET